MPSIQKTTNYSLFKLLPGNRDIFDSPLMESVKKKDMLACHPILVKPTGDGVHYDIIDGQHRWSVAKKLHLPLYYIVDENVEDKDIIDCQTQRVWHMGDYLNYYRRIDKNYELVWKIHNKYKYSVSFIVRVTSTRGQPFETFRKGEYVPAKSPFHYEQLFVFFDELMKFVKNLIGKNVSYKGQYSLWAIVNSKNYDHPKFMRLFDRNRDEVIEAFKFRDQGNITDYLCHRVVKIKGFDVE